MTVDPLGFTASQAAIAYVAQQEKLAKMEQEAREVIEGVKALPTVPPKPRRWRRDVFDFAIVLVLGMAAGLGAWWAGGGPFIIMFAGALVTFMTLIVYDHRKMRDWEANR